MKINIVDDFDGKIHEFEIADELYEKVYVKEDKDALYELALFLESTQEVSDLPVVDMMEDAWADGDGSELAGEWLDDYYVDDDDGRYDAWS